MLRILLGVTTTFLVAASGPAHAGDCPALGASTLDCQEAVAKASAGYARAHVQAVRTCLRAIQTGKLAGDPATLCLGDPPADSRTAGKLTNAASRLARSIGRQCSDTEVAALDLCAATVSGVGSCLVDEHVARLTEALTAAFGAVAPTGDTTLRKCQHAIGLESSRYLRTRLRAVQGCLDDRNRGCGGPDPLLRCLAPQQDGPRDEARAASTIARAEASLATRLASKCTDAQVAALDVCADTVSDAAACVTCAYANAGDLLVGADYRAVRVASPGQTTIQAAADAAEAGDTILIQDGTYSEEIVLKDSGLTLRGLKSCGTGARAIVLPPNASSVNGIFQCGSLLPGCTDIADDVLLQGFEVNDFLGNDVFAIGVEGITYRDMVTRGPGLEGQTEYGLFPIRSNNVLIEDCLATGISDAAIYVGQSGNIVVRNNEAHSSVAGIEIENSANAEVYGNYAHDNAGGLLVFKLAGLPVQLSDCHFIHDNRLENNNGPNFGHGIVGLVPSGTGMIVLSNDSSIFMNNIITGNNTFGLAVVDQVTLNTVFAPPPFPWPSPDQNVNDNSFIGNTITGNAGMPDPGLGFGADVLFLPSSQSGNCENGNTFGTDQGNFGGLPDCPTPPVQPGCPEEYPPTTTTTTVISTTTTTSFPAIWTWSGQVWPLLNTQCSACHGNNGTPQYAGFANIHDQAAGYANVVDQPSTQAAGVDRIEPGDHLMSYLWHKLNGTQASVGGSGSQMPQGGPFLSQAELDGIASWINAGAMND